MRRRFEEVTGFVLAGGASRRMGEDKANLILGGEKMVERQLRLLSSVCRRVAVLGPVSKFINLGRPVFPDELPGHGPLGGIYTGLRRTRTEFNLFLGCDLPFMGTRFLEFICRRALETRADVTVPNSRDGRLEPLCAVYRRRVLGAIRRSLELAQDKIALFFPRVRCEVVSWREMSGQGFGSTIFANMNTRGDYEAARRLF